MLSARVTDPQSLPSGLQIHRDKQTDAEDIKTCATPCVFPVGVDLVSARPVHSGLRQAKPLQRMVLHGPRGFAIPEVIICGYTIRAGHRLAINPPVDCKSTGTKLSFPLSQIKSLCPRGFAIPEVVICGCSIRAGHRPAINHPVDYKSTGTKLSFPLLQIKFRL